ncbi:MAG: hypothetical protein CND37_05125 [Bacteroidetes bacterium MED-G20]|mgnify:FL=1|nr:MAG: hypothetical protein CND37_05125 [Bacteroidetes bacterium MED-G20]
MLLLKGLLVIILFVLISLGNKAFSQNKGELIGSNRPVFSQNYKLPGNSSNKFEGLTNKDIEKQEHQNSKEQEKAKKEILKSHILKQDKPTRKRMKQTLKKSKKLLAKKPLVSRRRVVKQRKIILDQGKINKVDD